MKLDDVTRVKDGVVVTEKRNRSRRTLEWV